MRRLGLLLVALALAARPTPTPSSRRPSRSDDRASRRGVPRQRRRAAPWAPAFPVFRSRDLVDWRQIGACSRGRRRGSAASWAPELASEPGRLLAYWSAARSDGRPCIALSTAAVATGPWRYRGRVTCPRGGAIDAQPFRDADGSRWLLWKALGRGGAIMLQRLDAKGLKARGAPCDDRFPDPWRGIQRGPVAHPGRRPLPAVLLGRPVLRHPCTYAEGVAVAARLQGPYTEDPANPVLRDGPAWRCPGHGTVIRVAGAGLLLLHHAYRATTSSACGQVLLDRVTTSARTAGQWLPRRPASPPRPPAPRSSPRRTASPTASAGLPAGVGMAVRCAAGGEGARRHADAACDGPLRFLARQTVIDRLTAVAAVDPPTGDAAVGLAVDLGRGVRGVEVRRGAVRAFAASPSGVRTGPSIAGAARPHPAARLPGARRPRGDLRRRGSGGDDASRRRPGGRRLVTHPHRPDLSRPRRRSVRVSPGARGQPPGDPDPAGRPGGEQDRQEAHVVPGLGHERDVDDRS